MGRKEESLRLDKWVVSRVARCEEDYRKAYPETGETDLQIIRAFARGDSIQIIISNSNFSKPSVYRAANRVREYVKQRDIQIVLERFRHALETAAPDYGDWNAQNLLEMLYVGYGEYNRLDNGQIGVQFHKLQQSLSAMPTEQHEAVSAMVYDLCQQHQRIAFTEGVKIGVKLSDELKM